MQLRHRDCPICASSSASREFMSANFAESQMTEFSFSSRKLPEGMHLRMLLCANCDVLYASPAPDPAWLAAAYGDAAYDSTQEAEWAADNYQRLLLPLLDKLPDRDGALDIGTGHGAFLERLQSLGFSRITGIEPSLAPIQQAKPAIKPLIKTGLFSATDFPAASFSLISSFQTLEHVDGVSNMLQDIHRLLKPGGAFLTVSHNFRAISAKLLGPRSPIFDIEHLQLFSLSSMQKLLQSNGYTDIHTSRISNRYPLQYWLKLSPLPSPLKSQLLAASKRTQLGTLPIPLPAGNMLAYAIKRK